MLYLRTRYRSRLGWFFWFGPIYMTIRRNLGYGWRGISQCASDISSSFALFVIPVAICSTLLQMAKNTTFMFQICLYLCSYIGHGVRVALFTIYNILPQTNHLNMPKPCVSRKPQTFHAAFLR